jgi:hypothetical protein
MNKRAINLAIIYSVLVIIYKLIILLGGYQLTRFGFYYSHIISVFAIIPFMIIAIKQVRDKDYGGIIGGRQALNIGMTVAGLSVLILSIYHYVEFEWKLKDLSVSYYNSVEYLNFLKSNKQVKPENYQAIIDNNIASLSGFKAVTAKLFSFLLITLSTAFICAVFMKRTPRTI